MRRRRVAVRTNDILVVNGYELDAAILADIVTPNKRLLWAFVENTDGSIQPVAYSEDRVIWLSKEDLKRTAAEFEKG